MPRLRIAAGIFWIAGISYWGWDAWLTVTSGVRVGTWLMALFALALLFQGYGLLHGTDRVRLGGLISATVIAGAAAFIAVLFAFPDLPNSFDILPLAEVWPTLCGLVAIAAAFTVAAVLIATSESAPHRPK